MENKLAIAIKGLTIHRGSFCLDSVSLAIAHREIFALLGPTGSGKTVLLETIAGFYGRRYTGSVSLYGEAAEQLPPYRRQIGFVYQDQGLFPHMTIAQNIGYGLRIGKMAPERVDAEVRKMADLMNIASTLGQYPSTVSGGERQRAALARALVLNPRILLLDEPFSALDPTTKRMMYQVIRSIQGSFGCTIIFVTHDFSEAQELSDRIGILMKGRLRAVTESAMLFQNNYDEDIKEFLGEERFNEI